MISLALAAFGFLVLSFWANQILVSVLPRPIYLAVMFPGVVLHELAHFVTAIVTGTPVQEVKFFSSSGGHVIHQKPRVPVFGQLVISFAPLAAGATAVYFLLKQIPLRISSGFHIPLSSYNLPILLPSGSWHAIDFLWAYLALSITLTLMPSKQDVVSAIAGVLAAIVIITLLYINNWLQIPPEITGLIWYINVILAAIIIVCLPVKVMLKK